MPPLVIALKLKNLHMIKLLLHNGADPNAVEWREDPKYSPEMIANHNNEHDCWIIIGNARRGGPRIYDVTRFLDDHPGGPEIVLEYAGTNADEMFEDIGHSNEARRKMKQFLVAPVDFGWSALHWACYTDNVTAADLLLKTGANPNALDRMAETPLHAVFNMKHNSISPVAENLIAYGADINVKNAHGKSPLDLCSLEDRRVKLQALFAEQECGLK